MYPALHSTSRDDGTVQCLLCPHSCILEDDQFGRCNTRVNRKGILHTESYGILSSISTDPVEKKPLYHFYPGRSILSIGSFGCNLSCDFCQNCEISQIDSYVFSHHPEREPQDIVHKARLHRDNIGLAYTYNEPTVYYEYMLQCAELISNAGLKNVMVTNGYINREPLEQLLPYMDAFNVDLKSFRDEFYKSRSGAKLNPVLDTISRIAGTDRHLELTFLIIPGSNDRKQEWIDMISWIAENCGKDTVLHVSRYFPRYKLRRPPTPIETIREFIEMAREEIRFVYPGNTPLLENNTYCPGCGQLLIERHLYHTRMTGLENNGHCSNCDHEIYGAF
jgi:pyruvate formate lyase activating enzyme